MTKITIDPEQCKSIINEVVTEIENAVTAFKNECEKVAAELADGGAAAGGDIGRAAQDSFVTNVEDPFEVLKANLNNFTTRLDTIVLNNLQASDEIQIAYSSANNG